MSVFAVACLFLSSLAVSLLAGSSPVITSIKIERTNVVVSATIPAGVRKVTLQTRQRAVGSAWEPRAVARFDGSAEVDTSFNLPLSAKLEVIRIQGDSSEPLPASFYTGTNNFGGQPTGGGMVMVGDILDRTTMPGANAGGPEASERSVVESDIWNVSGNRVYFFNQYRGLQIIDISKATAPIVESTLSFPAAGEQMYLLNDDYAVLLARNNCGWGGSDSDSSVVLVDVRDKKAPKVATLLPVPGYIQESRLVGTALYVASQAYRPSPGNASMWEWGSSITSFDLADAAKPAKKDSYWFLGYGNVITATDNYLFLSAIQQDNWYQSVIQILDISAPNGAMKLVSKLAPAGQVQDKFKMNLNGDIFTVISQTWDEKRRFVTRLETFSLKDASNPTKLGSLELAAGEQLHATRFDGDQVYVVTFFRIDPLWIVDLSNPANPAIRGELQVPGWSTYIHPLADHRLLTIGIDPTNGWKVAVSLFDVQDRSKPALLSKVFLGENYSWSEANNDEKAFGVFEDEGLVLVPYQGYATNGYASRVQLIDLGAQALKLRGMIDHAFQPRRATAISNHIFSISGRELIAVDATDRDHPAVESNTELSWNVSRVLIAGDYLLEIDQGDSWSWNGIPNPSVRVAQKTGANAVQAVLNLKQHLPIVGSTIKDNTLYIAQTERGYQFSLFAKVEDGTDGTTNAPAAIAQNFFVTAIDLSKLPSISVLGQGSTALPEIGWGSTMQPLWPKPNLLVWSGGGGYYGPIFMATARPAGGVADIAVGGRFWNPWFWGGNSGKLIAFDVKDATAPKFLSNVSITSNSWWNYSDSFAADGLVYSSHQASEFLDGVIVPGFEQPAATVTMDEDGKRITNQPPVGVWVQKYYLDVVDYADPVTPLQRKAVNIPGLLRGIAANGSILFTVGPKWAKDYSTDWVEWLDASAYDGVSVHLVDSLKLERYPHPLLVQNDRLLLGEAGETNISPALQSWALNVKGRLEMRSSVPLKSSPQTIASFGDLVAVQGTSEVNFLTAADPDKLQLLGIAPMDFCYYFDLRMGDGRVDEAYWAPLADYGLKKLDFKPAAVVGQ